MASSVGPIGTVLGFDSARYRLLTLPIVTVLELLTYLLTTDY